MYYSIFRLFEIYQNRRIWAVEKKSTRWREGARSLRRNRLWLDGGGSHGLHMLFQGHVAGNAGSGPIVDAADGGWIKPLHHLRAADNCGAVNEQGSSLKCVEGALEKGVKSARRIVQRHSMQWWGLRLKGSKCSSLTLLVLCVLPDFILTTTCWGK